MTSASERPGAWAKDHCDYLLDSIDAQLSQLQEPGRIIKGSNDSGKTSLKETLGTDATADLARCSEVRDREASPGEDPSTWEEDYAWWLVRFLDLGAALGDGARSDSVCTEDFVARFNEALVDPLPSSEEGGTALALDSEPLKRAAGNPVNTSLPFADYEAASDCCSADSARKRGIAQLPKGGSEEEWDQEKDLAASLRDTPPLCIPHRIKSAGSLGEQISWLSRKWPMDETSGATDALKNHKPWKRVLQLRPTSSREGSLGSEISSESIFLRPQQEQRSSEDSFEGLRGAHENTESLLLLEDLRPSQPLPASGIKTALESGSPSVGTAECGYPKEQSSCPGGSSDVTWPCAIRASLAPSNEEDGGGSKTPLCLYPQRSWAPGKMQRLALSGIGMDRGATQATHKAPGAASNGSMGCRKKRTVGAHCTDRHNEAPGPEESTGLSIEKSLLPLQQDLLRSPGCSDGGRKDEDDLFARLSRAGESWKWDTSRGSEYGGNIAELGGYRNLKELELEEEKLTQKRAQIREVDVYLQGVLQQKQVSPGANEAGMQWVQGLEERMSALQATLGEKDLELLRLRQTISALEAEKASWSVTAESLAEEHKKQLGLLQQQKEEELTQLQEELEGKKQQDLRELAESLKMAKARALQEQATKFQKETEDLRKTITEQNAEIAQQQKTMEQQAKKWQEAQERVRNSLLQERKSWEAKMRATLQVQHRMLKEQEQKTQGALQEALEKEKKLSLALRNEAADLRKRIRVLEGEAQEKKRAMEDLRALLQAEKAEALMRLREELELEKLQEKEKWQMQLQQMGEEQRLLLAEQCKTSQAQMATADGSLAREVTLACQRLRDLLPPKASLPQMLRGEPALLSSSLALRALQQVTEETQHYLRELKHEAEVHRNQALQIQREKEQELRQQQEKLLLENQSALDALKKQLVQEHLEDIAALQSSWAKETARKEDASPQQQQLQKDGELQSQRSVASWKGKTSYRLACEFKEELEAEVERRLSKNKPMDFHRNLKASGLEFREFCMGRNQYLHPGSFCSPALSADPFSIHRLFSTPKLLQHLQRRIRELRAENALYCRGSSSNCGHLQENLTNTYGSKSHPTPELSSSQLHRKSSWK